MRNNKNIAVAAALFLVVVFCCGALLSCAVESGDQELTKNVYAELVDWHVSGLWVINCPVAWLRIANYNSVPVRNLTVQYNTYDIDGVPLDQGTYTIEDKIAPKSVRNFIELYLGLVSLHSEKLSVKLVSVCGD